jgi:hypothetical protein
MTKHISQIVPPRPMLLLGAMSGFSGYFGC